MRWAVVACVLLVSAPVVAQVNSQPTAPPIVTAENDVWFRRGEPVVFWGEFYYQTGPVVFFNGDVMVRTGDYNGVPLYVDTTIEPYSMVLVPIGRGRMQPYERIRGGDLAGTTGSRTPSFPGRTYRDPIPLSTDTITASTPEVGAVPTTGSTVPEIVSEEPIAAPRPARGKPFSYDSISIQYMGEKWVMAGSSGPLRVGLIEVGEYREFPVYAEKGRERTRIYLQIAPGRFAPFKPQD
jgi:hypothetical protein